VENVIIFSAMNFIFADATLAQLIPADLQEVAVKTTEKESSFSVIKETPTN